MVAQNYRYHSKQFVGQMVSNSAVDTDDHGSWEVFRAGFIIAELVGAQMRGLLTSATFMIINYSLEINSSVCNNLFTFWPLHP